MMALVTHFTGQYSNSLLIPVGEEGIVSREMRWYIN